MCINAVRRPTPRRVFSHHGELFLRVAAKVDGLAVHYELLKTAEAKSGQRNREKAKGRGTMCANHSIWSVGAPLQIMCDTW